MQLLKGTTGVFMDDSTGINKEMAGKGKKEKKIIDLTDIVEKGPGFINKDLDKKSYSNEEIDNDDIIELTSTVEDDSDNSSDNDLISNIDDLSNVVEDDAEFSGLIDNDSFDYDSKSSHGNPQLTEQQIEIVLEKIINEKFSQKIETIILQVVEKVVAKEIADIKKTMAE